MMILYIVLIYDSGLPKLLLKMYSLESPRPTPRTDNTFCVYTLSRSVPQTFFLVTPCLNRGDARGTVLRRGSSTESLSDLPGRDHHRLHQRRNEDTKQLPNFQVRRRFLEERGSADTEQKKLHIKHHLSICFV